jgi:hypothetical protein
LHDEEVHDRHSYYIDDKMKWLATVMALVG